MTRRERQNQFSDALHEWLRLNCGPLTVGEIAGILQVHIITMTVNGMDEEEVDELDGEGWKG